MILPGVELNVCPAFGWMGGPNFETLIKGLRNGHERRRPVWGTVKHNYSLPFQNIDNDVYLSDLKSLFLAAWGQTHSFLAKDYTDFEVEGSVFGAGDGVQSSFDLIKQYTVGQASYSRRILFPIDPVFFVNGVQASATFDPLTQRVVFSSPPPALSTLTWTGEFRVLVRFASDSFPMSIENRSNAGYTISGSVDLVEVWE